jgi:murein DD-endopeptidase MepM/ murein hydrolase activator NlpD
VRAESRAEAADARAGAEFAVPVDGLLTSDFGIRRDPFTGDEDFHGGVDLAAPRGTPIRVAADGEVVFSGRRGASGNVIVVQHADGVTTSYAHAERALAVAGQEVVAGDVIATVGSSGRSTGPHLHFAARRNGQLIDPRELLPELGEGAGRG